MSSDEYIFITGVGRTGSQLFRKILNSGTEVAMLPEIKFITPWEKDVLSLIKYNHSLKDDSKLKSFVDSLWSGNIQAEFWIEIQKKKIAVDKDDFLNRLEKTDRSAKNILKTLIDLYSEYFNKSRGGAKFPVHFSYTNQLLDWFPNSKILHIVRDPRATSISHARNLIPSFKNKPFYESLNFLYYKSLVFHGVFDWMWDSAYNRNFLKDSNYHTNKYEDLISNPEFYIKDICKFLKIKFNTKMLNPPVVDSSYKTIQTEGFNKDSINKWRNCISPFDKCWVTLLTKKSMKKYGYKK